MSHLDATQADINSRAPFSRSFRNAASKFPPFRNGCRNTKTETFPIPRVLYVRISRKEAIFYGMSTKEDIVDDLLVEDEDKIEEEVSEVTVMEIYNLINECMRETEEDINRRLLQNHEVVNKGCYRKRRVLCGTFPSHFGKFLAMMELSDIISRCAIVLIQPHFRKL